MYLLIRCTKGFLINGWCSYLDTAERNVRIFLHSGVILTTQEEGSDQTWNA
jgi:hypothetical protein